MRNPKAILYSTLAIATLFSTALPQMAIACSDHFEDNEGDSIITSGVDPETLFRNQQAYFNSDYTYDDAAVLAEFWSTSIGESKARIGRKLLGTPADVQILNAFLEEARIETGYIPPQIVEATPERNAFFASDYTFDDAVMLADFWGTSLNESKSRIGRKILWGGENIQVLNDALEAAIEQAEQTGRF